MQRWIGEWQGACNFVFADSYDDFKTKKKYWTPNVYMLMTNSNNLPVITSWWNKPIHFDIYNDEVLNVNVVDILNEVQFRVQISTIQ